MNNRLPNDILLHVFSFLSNTPSISQARNVCKLWHTLITQNPFLQIRPEYLEKYKASKLSIKEFYQQNIEAHIDSIYVVTKPAFATLHKGLIFTEFMRTEPIINHLKSESTVKCFATKEEAIQYADNFSLNIKDQRNSKIWLYTPILLVKINNPNNINKNSANENEISTTEIIKIYSLFYKGGDPSTLLTRPPQEVTINRSTEIKKKSEASLKLNI